MWRVVRGIAWGTSLLGLLVAVPAWAQDLTAARVQEALDATDQRIQLAETLVTDSGNPQAALELSRARDIQTSARQAFSSAQLEIAARLTIEARGHADRAIAIVRGLPDPDRVLVQTERTREILDDMRGRIESCDQLRARALLRVALEMQDRAEAAFRDSRFLAALQLTMSARERAFRAMRLCGIQESLQQSATRALQRTDDVLARARDLVDASAPEPARQQLARAVSLQADAQSAFRSQHWDAALQLTQSARMLAQRAIRGAGGPGRGGRP